jgi:hypothetical protein
MQAETQYAGKSLRTIVTIIKRLSVGGRNEIVVTAKRHSPTASSVLLQHTGWKRQAADSPHRRRK